MLYQFYYSKPEGRLLHPVEVQRKTGIPINTDPLDEVPLRYDPTEYIQALNDASIYPLTETADHHDPALYTTTFTYVVSNYPTGAEIVTGYLGLPGDYATQFYTATAISLADAKVAAISILKDRAKANAETASNGFPAIVLAASASKAASSRDATVQSALDAVNAVLTQLITDITAVNAATTVADIDTLINP